MTFEARLIIIILLFALWGFLGFLPWSVAAVIRRGRYVLPALPLALASAGIAGVLVPLIGGRSDLSFLISIVTAFIGGVLGTVGGVALALRFGFR